MRANETWAGALYSMGNEEDCLKDRKLFVENLGELLSQTNQQVISAELDDEENYQVSGEQKYRRAQIEYELIADAIDAQIRNDDTLNELAGLRAAINRQAAEAESLLHSNATAEELKVALKNLVATAALLCRYQEKY